MSFSWHADDRVTYISDNQRNLITAIDLYALSLADARTVDKGAVLAVNSFESNSLSEDEVSSYL